MKKIVFILILLFPAVCIFAFESTPETAQFVWNPENTALARIGFSTKSVDLVTDTAQGWNTVILLDNVRQDGDRIIAYSDSEEYVFWQLHGWNKAFSIYLKLEPLKNDAGTSLNYDFIFTDTEEKYMSSSDNISEGNGHLLYEYVSTDGVEVNSRPFRIEAELENGISTSTPYEGSVILSLVVFN